MESQFFELTGETYTLSTLMVRLKVYSLFLKFTNHSQNEPLCRDGKVLFSVSNPVITKEIQETGVASIRLNLGDKQNLRTNIDDVLKMTESSSSKPQNSNVLDEFDNLLDMSEFDGILESIDNNTNAKTNPGTVPSQTKPQIDILSELELLEDQNKRGTIAPSKGIDMDFFMNETDIEAKQQQLERQRKQYEEQQKLLEQQRLQQQQIMVSMQPVVGPSTVNQSKQNTGLKYDPNITFVLDDDDDDDWVPKMDDWDKIEKQKEKERKDRERREKKMKKKKKGTSDNNCDDNSNNTSLNLNSVSSTTSPRDPLSPRSDASFEEPKSPRQEKTVWLHRKPDYNSPRRTFLDTRMNGPQDVAGEVPNESQPLETVEPTVDTTTHPNEQDASPEIPEQVALSETPEHVALPETPEQVTSSETPEHVAPPETPEQVEPLETAELLSPLEPSSEIKQELETISNDLQTIDVPPVSTVTEKIEVTPQNVDNVPTESPTQENKEPVTSQVLTSGSIPMPQYSQLSFSMEALVQEPIKQEESNETPPADELVLAFDQIMADADIMMNQEIEKSNNTSSNTSTEDTIKFLDDVISSFTD